MTLILKAKNKLGNIALHKATLGRNEKVRKSLKKTCPNLVNEINLDGEISLIFKACEGGYAKIVEELCPLISVFVHRI